MARQTFATLIEKPLQEAFKVECKKQGYKQNEVIEILMQGFVDGNIQIEKTVSYKVIQSKK